MNEPTTSREGGGRRPAAGFSHVWLVSLGIGLLLLAGVGSWLRPLPWDILGARTLMQLCLAAWVGLCLRCLRRKCLLGSSLTLHQAFSFEVLFQCVRVLSPLLPHRAFEAEFMTQQLDGHRQAIEAWLRARALGVSIVILLATSLALQLLGQVLPAAAIAAAAVLLLAWRLRADRGGWRVLGVVLTGAVAWLAEGGLFAWAVADLLPSPTAWVLYLAFTGLFELVPMPFAVGTAELAALAGGGGIAFVLAVAFHCARLVPLAVLGAVYLPRYKFTVRDLLDHDVIALLRRTQRPPEGWTERPDARSGAPAVSIVIPAFNEAERLPSYLTQVVRHAESKPEAYEILVVDDGSTDDTGSLVEEFAARHPLVRLIRQVPNQGKGAAVRRGVLASEGRHVLFADADGATPIEELDKLLAVAAGSADVVVGSRRVVAEGVERERQGLRAIMGLAFYKMVNLLAVPGVRDTQCGFKLFRRAVAEQVFEQVLERGWAFDVEVLYLAQLLGYRIQEVPVNWREIPGSKVSPLRDALRMFLSILRIRRRHAGFVAKSGVLRERPGDPAAEEPLP